jgi:hypothetical protein
MLPRIVVLSYDCELVPLYRPVIVQSLILVRLAYLETGPVIDGYMGEKVSFQTTLFPGCGISQFVLAEIVFLYQSVRL